jgi:hypothetical protein
MHSLGQQIIAMVEGIMAGQGTRAVIPLNYCFPAIGMEQDFIITVHPVNAPRQTGNAPSTGTVN